MMLVWLNGFMIALIAMAAVAFAFTDIMSDRLFGNKRAIFVLVLGLYAVYRTFRLKQLLKPKKEEE